MTDCLFCRMVAGEIPAQEGLRGTSTLSRSRTSIRRRPPTCSCPQEHIPGLKEASAEDADIIGRCHLTAAHLARQRGIEDGYRTVLNVGPGAGQSVFHLHVHLLGGRYLTWPPG